MTSVFECPSCRRRCVGESPPAGCDWCHGAPPERIGAATDAFDPAAYMRDVQNRPKAYGKIWLMAEALAKRKAVAK